MARKGREVLIIGGGVAGIAAAFAARDEGARVTLVEMLPQLGGRASGGMDFDPGRHLVPNVYHDFLRLTDRLGSTGELELRPLALGARIGTRAPFWHFHTNTPLMDLGPAFGLLNSALLPLPARFAALGSLVQSLSRAPEEPADDAVLDRGAPQGSGTMTVAELLRRAHWPRSLAERVGRPLCLGMLNAPPEEAAADPFLTALKRLMGRKEPAAGWTRTHSGALITDPAPNALKEAGVTVLLSTRVQGLERGDRWKVLTRDTTLEADRVIVTTPPSQLRFLEGVEAGAKLHAMAEQVRGRMILTLRARFDRASILPGPLVEVTGERAIWFSEPHPEGGTRVERVLSGLSSDPPPDTDALLRECVEDARRWLNAGELLASEARPYAGATPSLRPDTPRPSVRQARGLYYAGDWTATGLPATLESAARAGRLAGEAAARDRGQ